MHMEGAFDLYADMEITTLKQTKYHTTPVPGDVYIRNCSHWGTS